jgi:hypothetical protein
MSTSDRLPRLERYKYSRGICESEEHYCWFKESLIGYERHFVLVFRYDSDRVVSPADVDCGD